jgi:DNA (cytosine-5)-methyltransferase 1
LRRAGFQEVVGVDLRRQSNYPFEFRLGDALDFPIDGFDFVWASPPCQAFSSMRHAPGAKGAPRLIGAIRERLIASDVPYWVIENVEGARAEMRDPVMLCGSMFGLSAQGCRLERHRLFEANFPIPQPPCRHDARPVVGIYGGHARRRAASAGGRGTKDTWTGGHRAAASQALGISWMTLTELSDAVPPVYAEHVGAAALAAMAAGTSGRYLPTGPSRNPARNGLYGARRPPFLRTEQTASETKA